MSEGWQAPERHPQRHKGQWMCLLLSSCCGHEQQLCGGSTMTFYRQLALTHTHTHKHPGLYLRGRMEFRTGTLDGRLTDPSDEPDDNSNKTLLDGTGNFTRGVCGQPSSPREPGSCFLADGPCVMGSLAASSTCSSTRRTRHCPPPGPLTQGRSSCQGGKRFPLFCPLTHP